MRQRGPDWSHDAERARGVRRAGALILLAFGVGIGLLGCAGIPFVEGMFAMNGAGAGITNPKEAQRVRREHIGARIFVGGIVAIGGGMVIAGV